VFGKLVGGDDVLAAIEAVPTKPGTDKPAKLIKITEIIVYQDPFEEYKKRIAKKQAAATAAATGGGRDKSSEKGSDDVNWFGEKISRAATTGGDANIGTGGVGKYLASTTGAKRSITSTNDSFGGGDEPGAKKKKKLGFGDFESW